MKLQFLDFEVSEDADGSAVFDALASVSAAQLPRLHAEVAAVLGWAHQAFPGGRAPLEDGGDWDYQLDGALEVRIPQALTFDEDSGAITCSDLPAGPARHAVSLSIAGSLSFCDAFREKFASD